MGATGFATLAAERRAGFRPAPALAAVLAVTAAIARALVARAVAGFGPVTRRRFAGVALGTREKRPAVAAFRGGAEGAGRAGTRGLGFSHGVFQ